MTIVFNKNNKSNTEKGTGHNIAIDKYEDLSSGEESLKLWLYERWPFV